MVILLNWLPKLSGTGISQGEMMWCEVQYFLPGWLVFNAIGKEGNYSLAIKQDT